MKIIIGILTFLVIVGVGYYFFVSHPEPKKIIKKKVQEKVVTHKLGPMTITSSAFSHEGSIPSLYTCDGVNAHPPLTFSDVPAGTQSLLLIMEDPDVPKVIRPDGIWDHWLVWNIPPTTTEIKESEGVPGIQGKNTGGNKSYGGPCPPDREHRYYFKLYALDAKLELSPNTATKDDIYRAIEGHVISKAELMGRYDRHSS